jgi:hypothetical protein
MELFQSRFKESKRVFLQPKKMSQFADLVSSIKRAPVAHVRNLITLGGIPENPLAEFGGRVWAPLLTILMRRDSGASKQKTEDDILTIAKMLVENGENVNERNAFGKTPCDIAQAKGYDKVVIYLTGIALNP